MKRGSSGFEQCYNAQIAVDETERIIVATHVTQNAGDVQELEPLMDQIEENLGEYPKKALADAGYRSESNFQDLEDRDIEGFVVFGREKNGQSKEPDASDEASVRMAKKMQSVRGQDQYRKRKYLGEPPFAWIKSVMGFRQFSLRGVDKVSGEWDLACLAMNLKTDAPQDGVGLRMKRERSRKETAEQDVMGLQRVQSGAHSPTVR